MNTFETFFAGPKDEEKDEAGDEVVIDNLMHDIKEGFIQRRLPDGGFKVGNCYCPYLLSSCVMLTLCLRPL